MRGVNKVIIIGTLGADPEIKQLNNGGIVANISVATSEAWNDRQTGERKEHTEWHRVSLFNSGNYKMAEIAQQYLRKGSQVYLEGKLKTRKYQDQQGQDRYITDIVVESMQMLGGGSRSGGQPDYNNNGGYTGNYPQQNTYPQNANPYQQNTGYQQPPAQNYQNQYNNQQGQYNGNPNYPQQPQQPQYQQNQPLMGNQFMPQNQMPSQPVAPQTQPNVAQPMQQQPNVAQPPVNMAQPQPQMQSQPNVAQPPANMAQPIAQPQSQQPPQNDIPPVAPMTGMPNMPKSGAVDDDIPF